MSPERRGRRENFLDPFGHDEHLGQAGNRIGRTVLILCQVGEFKQVPKGRFSLNPILHNVVTLGTAEIQIQQLASLEDLFLYGLEGSSKVSMTRAASFHSCRALRQSVLLIMAMTALGSLGNFSAKTKGAGALPKSPDYPSYRNLQITNAPDKPIVGVFFYFGVLFVFKSYFQFVQKGEAPAKSPLPIIA